MVVGAAAIVFGGAAPRPGAQAGEPAVSALVEAAANYIQNYESTLGLLAVTVTYTETESSKSVPVSTNAGVQTTETKRTFRGELLLTFDVSNQEWISARDIATIDNKPTEDHQDLQTLLRAQGAAPVALWLRQRNMNALGFTERNVDGPTFALQIVERRNAGRFQFTRGGSTKQNGDTLVTLKFEEKGEPTLVLGENSRPIHSSGEITIDAATGGVRKTVIRFKDTALKGGTTTTYALNGPLSLWLPDRFTENWDITDGGITGDERYSDWHRLEKAR
jgi:hypothetical protein